MIFRGRGRQTVDQSMSNIMEWKRLFLSYSTLHRSTPQSSLVPDTEFSTTLIFDFQETTLGD